MEDIYEKRCYITYIHSEQYIKFYEPYMDGCTYDALIKGMTQK